jgi:hypothetical protein
MRWIYKECRKIYSKVDDEAERQYYREMFDRTCNSVKQLWHNLNVVCSIRKQSHNTVSKILSDNVDKAEISNSFNYFFYTI